MDDPKVRLLKGEIGAKPSVRKRASVPEYLRGYAEYVQTNNPADKHPDLARIRALQDFFARKGIRYLGHVTPFLVDGFRTRVSARKTPIAELSPRPACKRALVNDLF